MLTRKAVVDAGLDEGLWWWKRIQYTLIPFAWLTAYYFCL